MTKRRTARVRALQFLYQVQLNPPDSYEDCLQEFQNRFRDDSEIREFSRMIVLGIKNEYQTIDDLIKAQSKNWALHRMPSVDLNILRIGTYELHFLAHLVPASASINEAIEIAKLYSGENSAPFVNGILDAIFQQVCHASEPKG